jgi:hypothetical protein
VQHYDATIPTDVPTAHAFAAAPAVHALESAQATPLEFLPAPTMPAQSSQAPLTQPESPPALVTQLDNPSRQSRRLFAPLPQAPQWPAARRDWSEWESVRDHWRGMPPEAADDGANDDADGGAVLLARLSAVGADLPELFAYFCWAELADPAVLLLAKQLVQESTPLRLCITLCRDVLRPKMVGLAVPASRPLLAAVLHLGQRQPKVLRQELLLPLLRGADFGPPQTEVVLRATRDSPDRDAAAARLLAEVAVLPTAGAAGPPVWGDAMLHLVHTLLGLKPALSAEGTLLPLLRDQLAPRADALRASAKYCSVLLALVKGYGLALRAHSPLLETSLRQSTCFLAKPALAALAKLTTCSGVGLC